MEKKIKAKEMCVSIKKTSDANLELSQDNVNILKRKRPRFVNTQVLIDLTPAVLRGFRRANP